MPNPFVKLPHNRGLTPEERVQPVPDTVAEIGDNIPYLGDVDHGVKGMHDFNTALVPDDTVRKVEYAKDDDMAPIPVRVVASDDHSEVRKMFRTNSFPVPALGSSPLRIASRNDHRTKLTLANTDAANAIYVSDQPDYTGLASFILGAKERIEFTHTSEVYVLSIGVATPILSVLQEFFVELD
jgi:hypothetical protein